MTRRKPFLKILALAIGLTLVFGIVTALALTSDSAAAITFTITGEGEYGDMLYLDTGVAVTADGLLEGVVAVDENGAPVEATVIDTDGLDWTSPQPRMEGSAETGLTPMPYILTYQAVHPETGETFTQTRECYVVVGIMPLA